MEIENKEQVNSKDESAFIGINGEQTGVGFTQRDFGVKNQEDQGEIEYVTLRNDRTHQNMKLLIDLKNIFARQLPKMPKEYIVKLVFDRNHEALCIMRNKKKLIGGICYRHYPTQRFAEIAFLAVTYTEQVRGYGTRLMNVFKEKMQKKNVEYLLTYADNYAIGYFKKQGFSKEHQMSQDRWKGYIKDYDGGTFMECYIHPKMDYKNISTIIKEQKKIVVDLVKSLCINDVKFSGIDVHKIQKNNNQYADEEMDTVIHIRDIPGMVQSGWVYEDYLDLKKSKERSFYLQCLNIIEQMRKHKCSWPFLEPVNKEEVPDYYNIITNPIDLKTIEKQLQNNQYKTKSQFLSDLNRIFENAKIYNQPETIYFKAANELEVFIQPYLHALKEDSNVQIDEETLFNTKKKKIPLKKKINKK